MAVRSAVWQQRGRTDVVSSIDIFPALVGEASEQQPRSKQVSPPCSPSSSSSPPPDAADDFLIRRLCQSGQSQSAILHALSRVLHTPLSPPTYLSLLKTSIAAKSLPLASGTREHIFRHAIPLHGFLGDYLVMALAKSGAVEDARQVSLLLPHLSVFAWTSIISAYAESGHGVEAMEAWQHMQNEGVDPDSFTFLSLFKACVVIADIEKGRILHVLARCRGFASNVFIGNAILSMYVSCGLFAEAQQAFNELSHRTSVSWNLLLAGTVEQGQWHKALDLLRQMEDDGAEPDSFTFVSLFKACTCIPDLLTGRQLHAYAKSKGLDSNPFVGNTIVSMYKKCGTLTEAEHAFSVLSTRDIVSWTGMLSVYVDHGEAESALYLYRQMRYEGIFLDQATFVIVLQACTLLAEKLEEHRAFYGAMKKSLLELGWALHADARRDNMHLDVMVATGFVTIYGKYGSLEDAENVFSSLKHPDLVAWNAMLSAYVENEQEEKALHLYAHLQKQGNSPNDITFVTALQACGMLGEMKGPHLNGRLYKTIAVEIAQSLHMDICTQGLESNLSIINTLISVYGKCSAIVEADSVFSATSECDVVSWNAMLSACMLLGRGEMVLHLYKKMQEAHIILDEVTYISICQASTKTGSLQMCEEVHFFVLCLEYDRVLAMEVTLMDAYGSLGRAVDAQALFDYIAQPNVVSWNACIACHAQEGDFEASMYVLDLMNQSMVEPNAVTLTSLMSVCSHSGLVADGFWYIEYMAAIQNITLEQTHYKLMIDILGRAEDFKRIHILLQFMPLRSDPVIWWCVLDACVTSGYFELGKQAVDYVCLFPAQGS